MLKEKLDPEVLIRAHFHGYDEEGCEDQSGQHTAAWVPMSLLNENEQQEEVIGNTFRSLFSRPSIC